MVNVHVHAYNVMALPVYGIDSTDHEYYYLTVSSKLINNKLSSDLLIVLKCAGRQIPFCYLSSVYDLELNRFPAGRMAYIGE